MGKRQDVSERQARQLFDNVLEQEREEERRSMYRRYRRLMMYLAETAPQGH